VPAQPPAPAAGTVSLVTLGCARNDVDSEELAGRLEAGGFRLVDDASSAETILVNTCGFVEAAKKDSVDTLLDAAELKADGATRAVVAVGCLAERYGKGLANSLPEADAVLGFDDYPDIAGTLTRILEGHGHRAHAPRDRRRLLPIAPAERDTSTVVVPGHTRVAPDLPPGVAPSSGPRAVRRRLDGGPMAPLKLASGCDRRCSFCAIPSFRGSFVSRRPADVLAEARWLAGQAVRELFLVSENSTSYGKDLGDLRLLETLLPELAAVEGICRVRVSYLQPAETRPGLVAAIAGTQGVAPYFDLSFQHASATVLRRMRRFGDPESFLGLLEQVRAQDRRAGIRSNVIVGFPGETEQDVEVLCDFLVAARLDVVGVFGYSDEDGTEAASYDGKLDEHEIRDRADRVGALVEELTAQRAEDRIGEPVDVLVERVEGGTAEGRAAHQGPEVDGSTTVHGLPAGVRRAPSLAPPKPRVGAVSSTSDPAPAPAPSNWNLPNALTTLRILMVPFFGWALLAHDGGSILWRCVAYLLFVAAAVTDKVDGDIARSRGLVTDFGKIADPIADKALTGMAFVGLSVIGELWWWVTVLVLVREWGVTALRFWVIRHGVMAASSGGKLKTVLQTVALGLLILPLRLLDGSWAGVGLVAWWVGAAVMAAAVAVTVVTGLDYVVKALAVRRKGRAGASL
jgi:ribosomal protein S12 methylthiotransferase